jgi:uncharacterized membrane protein
MPKFSVFRGILLYCQLSQRTTDNRGVKVDLNSRDLALISVFSAFYPIVQLMNLGFPVIGGPGIISLALILGPINGLILGPLNGCIATAIGASIGMATGIGTSFSPLVVLNRSLGAVEAGILSKRYLAVQGQGKRMPGWLTGVLLLAVVSCLWYFFPVGRSAPFYPSLHLTGLLIALLLDGRISLFLQSSNRFKVVLGVAVASYCALLADHMLGTIIFISVMGWHTSRYSTLFMQILPISLLERITLAFLATIIGTPILLVSRSMGVKIQRQ